MPRLRDSNPNNVMSPVPPVSSATSRLVLRYASGKFVTFLGREKRELPRLRDSDLNICCQTRQSIAVQTPC
jgi:hypothetical protein